MTTPPPPPPPDASGWPSSQPTQPSQANQPWPPSQSPAASTGGDRQTWWTGGRILIAIVVVLVLMGGSAVVGFIAGSTWGAFDTIADDLGLDEGLGDEVPGFVGVDAPAAEGDALQPGGQVSGTLDDRAVEHALTVESSREVEVEVTEADFDTVLVLLDSSGEVIESDDDGGSGTNSAVRATLSPGTYRVRVQPWGPGVGGAYTLAVD